MPEKKPSPAEVAIKTYLDRRAAADPQFAQRYANPRKNTGECFRFILSEARKRGSAVCMTDDEVFGLAVHYYDEADLKVPASVPLASVAHSAPAEKKVKAAKPAAEKAPAKAKPNPKPRYEQPPLFDL